MGKNVILAVMLVGLVLIAGCAQQKNKGTLHGTVTIGPLCPVEPCNVPPDVKEQAYAARKIIVYNQDMTETVATLDIANTGTYTTELEPGTYVIDIKHQGMDRSEEVPKEVKIEAGKMAMVDISIDTGLR